MNIPAPDATFINGVPYLETAAVAKRIGVSAVRIRVLAAQGRFLDARHFGAVWLIPLESVIEFQKQVRGRGKRVYVPEKIVKKRKQPKVPPKVQKARTGCGRPHRFPLTTYYASQVPKQPPPAWDIAKCKWGR